MKVIKGRLHLHCNSSACS